MKNIFKIAIGLNLCVLLLVSFGIYNSNNDKLGMKTSQIFDQRYIDDNSGSMQLGTGSGAPDPIQVTSTGVFTLGFDGNATPEQAFWGKEINHNWAEGTAISPHIHWMPSDTATGTIVWYLDWYVAKNSGSSPAELSGTVSTTVTWPTALAWQSTTTNFANITLPNNKIGTQILFRIYRIPTGVDTYSGDAALETLGYHYLVNTLGSTGLFTK